MVAVPFFCPDVPALKKNPVFLYSSDGFKKPYAFQADIAVGLDDVFDQKVYAISALESQHYEGGALGNAERMADVPPANQPKLRLAWLKAKWDRRQAGEANKFRDTLIHFYGKERGQKIKYAEVFEICEYGRRPKAAELRLLFPFFDKK
jgi:hypothetical protein